MNKKLKIATAAVSVVMAGTMAFGMFGCNTSKPTNTGKQQKYTVAAADADLSDTPLNINIGDSNQRSISFNVGELLSGTVKLPDGKDYNSSSLKPAWKAFSDKIGVPFNDVWQDAKEKVKNAKTNDRLGDMDIITAGCTEISDNATDMLDLSNYLDEMPNYAAFLKDNAIVRLSLTSNTTTGAMYAAPYFDGNNDIEKYELFKTNWVKALLDNTTGGDTTTTYKSHGTAKKMNGGDWGDTLTTSTAIEAYMGQTGSYTTDVLKADGTKGTITVNYDKALASAKSGTIASVLSGASIAAYEGTSGNIVDIMNHAINSKQGEVTGDTLLKILQEYIKVAYYVGGTETAFYTQSGYKLSDVFVGEGAAWDVDLYAALGRVLVTNPSLIKSGSAGNAIGGAGATELKQLWLLSARQNNMQRMIDTISMVGQLYGVRGLESKNLYAYIDSKGKLQDARGDQASYDAMKKFSAFWQEGLVFTGASGSNADQSYYKKDTPEALSTYDYVNTQTPVGFQLSGNILKADGTVNNSKYSVEEGYYYTPVITPVSKWDEDGSNEIEADEYFRFTESWRTTKDTGFCVPVNNVKNNPKKLRAVLKFIDTMFSHDGQILLTYGPKATSATENDGFWFNREATAAEIASGDYFEYEGKKLYHEGTAKYAGEYQPKVSANVMTAYYGGSVYGFCYDGSSGINWAGSDKTGSALGIAAKPTSDDKTEPTGKWKLANDTWEINKKGEFVKVTAGTELDKGTYYIVKATVAGHKENNEDVGEAYYFVDKDGKFANKSCKLVALVSSTANQWITGTTLNYTNFARYVIGSALPIGNKLQAFEFQLTSAMGRDGALIVDKAISAEVIRHTQNTIEEGKLWYTVVPTVLPYTKADTSSLGGTHVRLHDNGKDKYFTNNKDAKTNLYFQIIKYGYDATKINGVDTVTGLGLSGTTTAEAIINKLEDVDKFTAFETIKNTAWQKSKTYYSTLKK